MLPPWMSNEDVKQDIYVVLLGRPHILAFAEPLFAVWAKRLALDIVRNSTSSYRQNSVWSRHAARPQSLDALIDAGGEHHIDDLYTEDSPQEAHVLAHQVQKILRQLSERDQEIIHLHCEGWPSHVLAKRFGLSPGRITQVRTRSREMLAAA